LLKQFLVFKYDEHYPDGGWKDFKGSFDTSEEAMVSAKIETRDDVTWDGWDHVDIIDTDTGELFWSIQYQCTRCDSQDIESQKGVWRCKSCDCIWNVKL